MIRGLTLRTNSLQRKSYRSRYYGQENARRRMLAAERRRVARRTTTNPCPTPEAFRAAFAKALETARGGKGTVIDCKIGRDELVRPTILDWKKDYGIIVK